jgi:hypothetical protein
VTWSTVQLVGKRAEKSADGLLQFREGDFGQDQNGLWHGMAPGGHVCNLSAHHVTEHPDGTITVSPSIKISTTRPDGAGRMVEVELWHGHLERGVWKPC